jgi:SAM-dependent methyltransferase
MRREAEAHNAHPEVRYLPGDAQHLPLEDASCGAAWLSTVIHHIPDLGAAAAELARALVPAAPVLIRSAFPGRTGGITLFRFFPEAAAIVETFPSLDQVRRDFGASGFDVELVTAVPQVSVADLAEARARAALRADTTLRGIPDEAFAAGLRRMDDAIAAGGHEPVVDYLDLVVLRRAR